MPQYQGVWTLPVAARLQSNQQWATDPLYKNTALLLQADNAPNGAQNNTFIDSSSNNFTITRNGNTTQGTFTPYSATGWGNYFDGTGDNLSLASVTAVGNSNATVEFFIYPTDSSLTYRSVFDGRSSTGTDTGFAIFQYGAGVEVYGNGLKVASATGALNINQWNHVALTRSSGTCQVYVNGIASGSSATYSSNLTSTIARIGDSVNTAFPYIGYISNLRVVIGSVLYSGVTYTVPTAPLTAITNTSLLTCQSNRFVDNSTNAFAITVNGNTSVQAFSPFAPQYQYTPSVTGGSGYFDGTGDYLNLGGESAFAFGTGDFTIEMWVYFQTLPASGVGDFDNLIDFRPGGTNGVYPTIYLDGTAKTLRYLTNSADQITGSTTIVASTWYHVVVARSGTSTKMFLNGTQEGSTYTDSNSYLNGASRPFIAINSYNNSLGALNGYISNLRILKGTALYTTAFTPPTGPLTAIANTSVLLNFTNAGIVDGTMKNNLETAGDAKISTAVVKYGTGSMAFDGSGDYLSVRNNAALKLTTGDWTIEFWMYCTGAQSANTNAIWTQDNAGGGYTGLIISANSSRQVQFSSSTSGSTWDYLWQTIGTYTDNTWNHVAVTKSGSTVRGFFNGVLGLTINSFPATVFSTSDPSAIGLYGASYFTGYLDDFRITKGIARYTANFTPPTVALPRQ